MALKTGDEPSKFSFSRAWKCARTILHLSAEKLALLNVEVLIPDDALTSEDMIIGLPVLRHLKVDTKTLLEQNSAALVGTDCSTVNIASPYAKLGRVGRLMRACAGDIDRESTDLDTQRPTVNYYAARNEEDPFPDPSLFDARHDKEEHEVQRTVNDMVFKLSSKGVPQEYGYVKLSTPIRKSSPRPFRMDPADVPPLHVNLTPEAKPDRVRLHNYSPEQRDFLKSHVDELLRCNMIYLNPSATWASAPLLVSKPGPLDSGSLSTSGLSIVTLPWLSISCGTSSRN